MIVTVVIGIEIVIVIVFGPSLRVKVHSQTAVGRPLMIEVPFQGLGDTVVDLKRVVLHDFAWLIERGGELYFSRLATNNTNTTIVIL